MRAVRAWTTGRTRARRSTQALQQKIGEWMYISMLKVKIECLTYEYIPCYDSRW